MPFTPYHFGPSALLTWPLKKYIDVPVFVLANVAVDIEPLIVMLFRLNYPLHGFCHTFLIGSVVGLFWGLMAFSVKGVFNWPMRLLHPTYKTNIVKMMFSGILGVWFHIIFDSMLYRDIRPLWPFHVNPLLEILKYNTVFLICEISCLAAIVIFPALAISIYRKKNLSI